MELFLDFETRGTVDLREHGLANYLASPDTQSLMLAWAVDDSPVNLFQTHIDGQFSGELRDAILDPHVTKIAFNAHRIYSFQYVVDVLFSGLTLKEFSFIPTDLPYRFLKNADPACTANEVEGAGCFWLTKHACSDIGSSAA
jgi:hypothetical protein